MVVYGVSEFHDLYYIQLLAFYCQIMCSLLYLTVMHNSIGVHTIIEESLRNNRG